MSKIDKIYITCCKNDVLFTRICVASIRYWYPQIPVYLIKEYLYGDFNTSEIEKNWNVSVLSTNRKKFGRGFPKYEALFLQNGERVLAIDSDIVFGGRVIEALEVFDEDFIVSGGKVDDYHSAYVKNFFYIDQLFKYDPSYIFPGFCFNSGQIVATCGEIAESDFADFVDWSSAPLIKKRPNIIHMEQGILNYVLTKKLQLGQISIKFISFHWWANGVNNKEPILLKIKNGDGFPTLIHWAGEKVPILSRLALKDVLYLYEDFYYSKIKFGVFLRYFRYLYMYFKYAFFILPGKRFQILRKSINCHKN